MNGHALFAIEFGKKAIPMVSIDDRSIAFFLRRYRNGFSNGLFFRTIYNCFVCVSMQLVDMNDYQRQALEPRGQQTARVLFVHTLKVSSIKICMASQCYQVHIVSEKKTDWKHATHQQQQQWTTIEKYVLCAEPHINKATQSKRHRRENIRNNSIECAWTREWVSGKHVHKCAQQRHNTHTFIHIARPNHTRSQWTSKGERKGEAERDKTAQTQRNSAHTYTNTQTLVLYMYSKATTLVSQTNDRQRSAAAAA